MNTQIMLPPGYRVFEYQLVLSPSEDLQQRIFQLKKKFAQQFSLAEPSRLKPHITLARFRQHEMTEERIRQRLKNTAMGMRAFKIEMDGYGSFPSHSIFVNVTSKVPIQNLVRQVRTDAQRLMKMDADNKPYFITDPYVNIAQRLEPWQYEKAWLEYQQKHFTARFICESMLLLRRPEGELRYQVLESFDFRNLPVVTKQGALF